METAHCEICGRQPILRVGPEGNLQQCGRCGSVQALDRTTTQVYDAAYVAERYDRYTTTERMSQLRLRMLESVLTLFDLDTEVGGNRNHYQRLLDVGYGNGSFIRHACASGWSAFGHDVNDTEYEGVRRVWLPIGSRANCRYRVVTFFDCLEHFETLSEIREISRMTDWIFISIPAPPYVWWTSPNTWRHYRPGEHHFYPEISALPTLFSLPDVMVEQKWVGYPEDIIRGSLSDGKPNIATVALKCTHAKEREQR